MASEGCKEKLRHAAKVKEEESSTDAAWDLIAVLSQKVECESWAVRNVVELLDNDNTIPFIARYRKEKTGGMEPEKIREVKDELDGLRSVLLSYWSFWRCIVESQLSVFHLPQSCSEQDRKCHQITHQRWEAYSGCWESFASFSNLSWGWAFGEYFALYVANILVFAFENAGFLTSHFVLCIVCTF